MRPSLVAVLVLSLVGLSGAAMSDGMPAAKKTHHKITKTKVIKKHHRHGPECPPDHDDSWAIAEQLNHEEWLRHRQDDLSRRGGGYEDDQFSAYDDRFARNYAAREEDYEAWDRSGDDAELLAEAGAAGFQRDYGYDGRARRYVDKKVYQRYSASGGGHGWTGGYGEHGWGRGHGKTEHRVYKSYGGGHAWRDDDRFGGDRAETRRYESRGGYGYSDGYDEEVYAGGSRDFDERSGRYRHGGHERFDDDAVYAGGSRDFDERAGRYERPRHERRVIIEKRYGAGHRASRYGYADDYAAGYRGHGDDYGYAASGYGGGYSSSSSYSYGGGYRFHYDAGYAGRDAYGYLTWPGKAG